MITQTQPAGPLAMGVPLGAPLGVMETPVLLFDLAQLERTWHRFRTGFPAADIHYAVKANPAPEILRLLAGLGCRFDAASPAEVDLCLEAGARPAGISYGSTVKKSADIAYAYRRGVRLFAFDCEEELGKLAVHAPASKVFCRLEAGSEGASWPLSRKFGCGDELAETLLPRAKSLGLVPWGLSFHVGSQQTDPARWGDPLARCGKLFASLAAQGIRLGMVNLGGGFPAQYDAAVPSFDCYPRAIHAALDEHLARFAPRVMMEPGRGLVGDAGTIVSRVVLTSRREPGGARWVYLDIGKFGGLAETMEECIRYRIRAVGATGATGPVILAGPTCDSADILYERALYQLPLSLKEGDSVEILSAGAYTSSYASVGFNGFAPLATHFYSTR